MLEVNSFENDVMEAERMPTFTGRVIFQYFYDAGGELILEKVPKEKLNLIELHRKKARFLAPKYEEIGLEPIIVDLGAKKIDGHKMTFQGRIFPIGVIGIYSIIEFRNLSFDGLIKLVTLNERRVKIKGKEMEFDEVPLELFKELSKIVEPALAFPYPAFERPEIYTLILIAESEPSLGAQDFLSRYAKPVAGVLRGEKNWRSLGEKEVKDALKLYLSYSDDDIVLVDWYSTLMSGAVEYTDELVRIIEMAKIQLLELKTYDKILGQRIERSYSSLRFAFSSPRMGITWMSKSYNELVKATTELADARVEITNLVEDLRNILKFTGDWYLGKLYNITSERFRIPDWLSFVDKKLDRLQEIYTMAMERVDVHRATTLEFLSVLLVLAIVVLEIILVLKGI
jgi:hypothetical protein